MILHDKGIYYKGADLWMDSTRVKDECYVSHAHGDHTAKHNKIIGTPETAALVCQRTGKRAVETIDYGKWIKRNGCRFKLFPAGHVLGSSQILIETEYSRIVYTGDFRLGSSRTSTPATIEKCDVLLMETTYGSPKYSFPDRRETEEEFADFVRELLNEGKKPVILAYSLGKAQEAMSILGEYDLMMTVHDSIFKLARIYERFGVKFGRYSKFRGNYYDGILIVPPHMRQFKNIQAIPDTVFIMLTGWGADSSTSFRCPVDRTFIISDHCDHDSLLEYVREADPRKIFTLHGDYDFAGTLRKIGFDAQPLQEGREYKLDSSSRLAVNLDLFE